MLFKVTKTEKIDDKQEQVYEVQYFKIEEDTDGNQVEVIDKDRKEGLTVSQLQEQKAYYKAQIKEIDSKLAQMGLIK